MVLGEKHGTNYLPYTFLQDISERFIKNIVLQRISIAANIVDASIWFKTNYA